MSQINWANGMVEKNISTLFTLSAKVLLKILSTFSYHRAESCTRQMHKKINETNCRLKSIYFFQKIYFYSNETCTKVFYLPFLRKSMVKIPYFSLQFSFIRFKHNGLLHVYMIQTLMSLKKITVFFKKKVQEQQNHWDI